MMKTRIVYLVGVVCAILTVFFPVRLKAGPLADVICYWEIGTNPAGGPGWWNPEAVLVKEDEYGNINGISLGNWDDSSSAPPLSMTGGYDLNQGNEPGLVVGFSTAVLNGPGNDLRIQGNAMAIEGSEYYWSEPGYIEVAAETTPGQTGATADGWADETFYLIKPSNYDIVGDPRLGPLSDIYIYGDDPGGAKDEYGEPIQVQYYAGSWGEDLIAEGGSQLDLYGYADWNPAGDSVDISDAIDGSGHYPSQPLTNIAYVRIRTVTNDDAGLFGSMSTEVCYVENISTPEPATLTLLVMGGLLLRKRQRI